MFWLKNKKIIFWYTLLTKDLCDCVDNHDMLTVCTYNVNFLEEQTILSHDVVSGSDIMPCN